jgi:RNA ligase
MSSIPNKSKLDEYAKLGLVRSQTHPTLPLSIYVYTEMTAFERLWNSVTSVCRGLVVDDKDRCIVRCLPKFFNEDEPHALCGIDKNDTPIVFDKLDGSLIQVANDKEYGLIVTSKGSFASDQAKWAQQIISEKYTAEDFDQGKTYVFELIHPENRIVLDYGGLRDLFLLAVIDTEGGQEYDIFINRFEKFPKVKVIENQEEYLKDLVEGVVVKTGSHRYKLKTGEYLRLHRIVTEFTPKRVWEALRDGASLEFTNMPEEFQKWLDETIDDLQTQYNDIEIDALKEVKETESMSDKEVGLATNLKYKGIIFMVRNGKNPEQTIWKMVKPKKEEVL